MRELKYPQIGERCFRGQLPGGHMLYVIPKPGFKKCFAFFATSYGGEDTRFYAGKRLKTTPAGVAHFLEHKLFDMPDGNALQQLTANGASPNAFTSSNLTGYYFSCTDRFYENLKILIKFVTTPYFTEESVAKELGIIGKEIRMILDNPNWQLYHGLINSLYVNHPCKESIAGTEQSIARITPEVLNLCYSSFYLPTNMVLCVGGDLEPREVLEFAAAEYPGTKKPRVVREHGAPEPMTPAQPEILRECEVSAPNFLLGFKAEPSSSLRTTLAGELAAELLVGESSPLYHRLYAEGLIDKSFGVSFESNGETAHFLFGGESASPSAVADAILAEAVRLCWDGIDPELFQRLRKAAYGTRVRALNSFEHLAIQTARWHFGGTTYLDFSNLYDKITLTEITDLIRRCITGNRACLSVVTPKKS